MASALNKIFKTIHVSSPGTFVYDTLKDSSSSLRLVKILPPSKQKGLLKLTLQTFDFNACPAFEAVSYTWGPAERNIPAQEAVESKTIFINEGKFTITKNLHDFLFQFFQNGVSSDEEVWEIFLWIDALCINQKNIMERNTQVAHMDTIYRSAYVVTVWLGRDRDGTIPSVAAMLPKIGALYEHLWPNRKPPKDRTITIHNAPELLSRFGLPSVHEGAWLNLISFLSRQWFTRLWVLQEAALAQRLIVLCGSKELGWNDLYKTHCVLLCGLTSVLIQSQNRSQEIKEAFKYFHECSTRWQRFKTIQDWCLMPPEQLFFHPTFQIMSTQVNGPCLREGPTPGMLAGILLYLAKDFCASDPLDQAFALFGLINHLVQLDAQFGVVDYKTIAVEQHTTITCEILAVTNWMGLLSLFGANPRPNSGLPSWALDLARDKQPSTFVSWSEGPFNASKIGRSDPAFGYRNLSFPEPHLLETWGVKVSEVSFPLQETRGIAAGEETFEATAQILVSMPETYALTGEHRIDALWRTMLGNEFYPETADAMRQWFNHFWFLNFLHVMGLKVEEITSSSQYLTRLPFTNLLAETDPTGGLPTHASILDRVSRFAELPSSVRDEAQNVFKYKLETAGATCTRLFSTYQNHLGLGRPALRRDDELWILARAPNPYLLRKVKGSDNHYTIVGDCYVYGMMHGEAVGDQARWEKIIIE